jgi:hypothetical protein
MQPTPELLDAALHDRLNREQGRDEPCTNRESCA